MEVANSLNTMSLEELSEIASANILAREELFSTTKKTAFSLLESGHNTALNQVETLSDQIKAARGGFFSRLFSMFKPKSRESKIDTGFSDKTSNIAEDHNSDVDTEPGSATSSDSEVALTDEPKESMLGKMKTAGYKASLGNENADNDNKTKENGHDKIK